MQSGGTSHNGLLRFYSPGLGRWINRDPIGESGGLNMYGFVGNNPVNFGDDYGLQPMSLMDCHQLLNAIRETIAKLHGKIQDQLDNKNNLFLLYDKPNPNGKTGTTTWKGHTKQINNLKDRLENLKYWYDEGNCGNKHVRPNKNFPSNPYNVKHWMFTPTPTRPSTKAMDRLRIESQAKVNLENQKLQIYKPSYGQGYGLQGPAYSPSLGTVPAPSGGLRPAYAR